MTRLLVLFAVTTASLTACGSTTQTSRGAPAAVQMRPVQGETAGRCQTSSPIDPPMASPARVSSLSGAECFDLGPAVLGFGHVRTSVSQAAQPGVPPVLTVELPASATSALNSYASRNLGRKLAVVTIGRVVEAAEIEAPTYDGSLVVSGLDRSQLTAVRAAFGS